MLRAAGVERSDGPLLADVIGTVLADVARRLQAHCLVELEAGCVVAHALLPESPPPHVTDAVLRRTSAPLVDATRSSRRSSPLPGGPLLIGTTGQGDGWIHAAPLTRGGTRIGWLWLIAQSRLQPQVVAAELPGVATVLPAATPDAEQLAVAAAMTRGTSLPRDWVRAAQQAWVMTLSGRRPEDICPALGSASHGIRLLAMADGERTRAVALDDHGREMRNAEACLRDVVLHAEVRLEGVLQAGVSEAFDPLTPIAPAVQQADAAWLMSSTGQCTSIRHVRSRYALHVAREALRDLPDLGPDPVRLLREHDRRHATLVCRTLRAWLDADRDVAAAAEALFIHPNTLRYRLRKAERVIGMSLDDVDLQIDLHLRLEA